MAELSGKFPIEVWAVLGIYLGFLVIVITFSAIRQRWWQQVPAEETTWVKQFLAARQLGPAPLGLSLCMAMFSGDVIVRMTAQAFSTGYSGWRWVGTCTFISIVYLTYCARLQWLSRIRRYDSVLAYVRDRYGLRALWKEPLYWALVLVYLFPCFIALCAEMEVFGRALQTLSGGKLNKLESALILAAWLSAAETAAGLQGVAYCAVLQAVVLLVGVMFILVFMDTAFGGFQQATEQLEGADPSLVYVLDGTGMLDWAELWIGVGLQRAMLPDFPQRAMAAASQESLQVANAIFLAAPFLIYVPLLFFGIAARAYHPDLADPKEAFMQVVLDIVSGNEFGRILGGIMVAALASAIMSTGNSLLNVMTQIITVDVLSPIAAGCKVHCCGGRIPEEDEPVQEEKEEGGGEEAEERRSEDGGKGAMTPRSTEARSERSRGQGSAVVDDSEPQPLALAMQPHAAAGDMPIASTVTGLETEAAAGAGVAGDDLAVPVGTVGTSTPRAISLAPSSQGHVSERSARSASAASTGGYTEESKSTKPAEPVPTWLFVTSRLTSVLLAFGAAGVMQSNYDLEILLKLVTGILAQAFPTVIVGLYWRELQKWACLIGLIAGIIFACSFSLGGVRGGLLVSLGINLSATLVTAFILPHLSRPATKGHKEVLSRIFWRQPPAAMGPDARVEPTACFWVLLLFAASASWLALPLYRQFRNVDDNLSGTPIWAVSAIAVLLLIHGLLLYIVLFRWQAAGGWGHGQEGTLDGFPVAAGILEERSREQDVAAIQAQIADLKAEVQKLTTVVPGEGTVREAVRDEMNALFA